MISRDCPETVRNSSVAFLSDSDVFTAKYKKIWGPLNRAELAPTKLDVAKWDHERIRENLSVGGRMLDGRFHQSFTIQCLAGELGKFGIPAEQVGSAVSNLLAYDHNPDQRAQVHHRVPKSQLSAGALECFGIQFEPDKVRLFPPLVVLLGYLL